MGSSGQEGEGQPLGETAKGCQARGGMVGKGGEQQDYKTGEYKHADELY